MVNSKQKGARFERLLASKLREFGYSDARRGQQYCGSNGDADVVGLPHLHIEAKHQEKMCLYDWMAQAIRDARTEEIPVVIHKKNNADILVSTTVIEVGIDVPNATVIMIENAERFGLSQLHQLRGRVGRGSAASYCILMSDAKKDGTLNRLKVLNRTNDGFEIAREDMKLRGPGELNGVRQSGELQFGLGDIVNDSDILELVAAEYDGLSERLINLKGNLIDFRTI